MTLWYTCGYWGKVPEPDGSWYDTSVRFVNLTVWMCVGGQGLVTLWYTWVYGGKVPEPDGSWYDISVRFVNLTVWMCVGW